MNIFNGDKQLCKDISEILIKETNELKYLKPKLTLKIESTSKKVINLDKNDLKNLLLKYGELKNISYNQQNNL